MRKAEKNLVVRIFHVSTMSRRTHTHCSKANDDKHISNRRQSRREILVSIALNFALLSLQLLFEGKISASEKIN